MKNKNGFTLMELLIAATIVGILSLVATVSYQNSMAENRIANAKAKVDQIVNAIQRYEYEHSGTINIAGELGDIGTGAVSCSSSTKDYQVLIACGLLDRNGWNDPYVKYYICNKSKSDNCSGSKIDAPWACMKMQGSKLPQKYQNYMYCATPIAKGSTF